jgi:K+-sensing histidine kinase KdpD
MVKLNDEKTPTVLVCIDTSNASESALRYACHKAKIKGFAVQILAVMEASHKNLLFGAKAIGNEKRQLLEKHLQKLIETVCKETGIIPSISVREGDIATEIIREIKATASCAMLIFGKSNNAQSDNTVLPKIVQKIGNKISVPVTIVPQNLSSEFLANLV